MHIVTIGVRPRALRIVAALMLAVTVPVAVACTTALSERLALSRGEDGKPVYVVGHGWHVGLAMRRADVRPDLWDVAHELGAFEHVEVGWGDGAFYPAERGTLALALRAAFASKTSVLHVAAFDPPVPTFFAGAPVVELRLTPDGFDEMCRFIAAAFARDPVGRPLVLRPGLYGWSRFYLARTRYHVFDNSNNWAARALHAGGVPVTPALSWYAGTVIAQIAPLGVVHRAASH